MKKREAIKHLMDGKKVKYKDWRETSYLQVVNGSVLGFSNVGRGPAYSFTEQLDTDNWEVIEDTWVDCTFGEAIDDITEGKECRVKVFEGRRNVVFKFLSGVLYLYDCRGELVNSRYSLEYLNKRQWQRKEL